MATLSMALILMFSAVSAGADGPKYVFFFLGDGMASAQIQATEAYLTTFNGGSAAVAEDLLKSENRLNMSKMPVQGMQTTYDSFALMTDSASSATAFACGLKTKSGVIGMDNSMTASYKSVAQLAFEGGKKVGVISSVSLDHATPAAYYASVANRGLMNNIATQLANTGYDFFGGGGLASPSGPARSGDTANDVWGLLATNGYTVLKTRDDILALKSAPKNKVVCINPWLQDSAAMPYDIDRPATNLSLAEMTEVAIACLKDEKPGRGKGHPRDGGFFLMVEGGKIDWACHANDAMATIGDMLDFDNAVGVALGFYKRYPQQTLIIVTGDHETGGMSVGHATTGYTAHYDRLLDQTCSFTYFAQNQWAAHKEANAGGYDWTNPANLAGSSEMTALMLSAFGLDYNSLNDYQKEKLEDAYDKSMSGTNDNSKPENDLLYGGYEAIVVTITHILNERASIGWTSYSHTGVPVPVFAQGSQAKRFAGFYDNTDIAKQLAKAMGINEELPIAK
ncbi:MAG: alkaline phosphatase [Desulfobacterales bacterium]|nr:alkaline phosphatase [Desulfobacterales bacterium]